MTTAPRLALLVLLGSSWAAPVALAQSGEEAAASLSGPLTERVYAADTLELKRWSDSEVMVKSVPKGAELQVLLRDGDMVRVLIGTSMGWAPADQLLDAAPAEEEAEGGSVLNLGGPPSLGFGGIPGGAGGLGSTPPALPPPSE